MSRGFEPLGLDHLVLRVRDQAASQRFYIDVLGCTLDHVNERIALVQLRFGGQLIDLLPGERAEGAAWTTSACRSAAGTWPRSGTACAPAA